MARFTIMATSIATRLSLTRRPRRLRRTEAIRSLVRETRLTPDCFIYPLFVRDGEGVRREVDSMPGVFQLSVDEAVKEAAAAKADGVPGVLLFGLPESEGRDRIACRRSGGSSAVARSVRSSARSPACSVMTDVCLCEYTSHGHCGIVDGDEILNDATVTHLIQAALSHAVAGADFVAPSDMMDGRIGAIRRALDERDFVHTGIVSYAAKYCSGFYGPFREAADSTPQFGDRRSHQMDPANVEEALREVDIDIAEGADIVMVKPAVPYLDVIHRVKTRFGQPDRRVSRERRVRDDQGGGGARVDRRAARDDGDADVDPTRGRGHDRHVLRT